MVCWDYLYSLLGSLFLMIKCSVIWDVILVAIKSAMIRECVYVYNCCITTVRDMRNDCPDGHLGQNRAFPVIYNIIWLMWTTEKIKQ